MQKLIIAAVLTLICIPISHAQIQDCPSYGAKVAVGTPESKKIKKKVYNVECEDLAVPDICLPRPIFCFRQQLARLFAPKCIPGAPCGCGPEGCTTEPIRNGHVRTIKVLKKKNVECEICAYKWAVKDYATCSNGICDLGDLQVPLESPQNNPPSGDMKPLQPEKAEPGNEQKPANAVNLNFSDQLYLPQPVRLPEIKNPQARIPTENRKLPPNVFRR